MLVISQVTREPVSWKPEETVAPVDDQKGLRFSKQHFLRVGNGWKVKDEWQTMVLEPVLLGCRTLQNLLV